MNPRDFDFLLACLKSTPDGDSIRGFISGGVDWQILLAHAAQHGVRAILFQTLKSLCWDAVPRAIQADLLRITRANAQRNLLLTAELLHLIDKFRQADIPIAAFKGPVLAGSVYGDLALREFSDLDVLVPEEHVSDAERILARLEYRADFSEDQQYRSAFLRYQGQYAFRNRKTAISVDLHWQLSSRGIKFPIQPKELWPRLKKVTLAGRMIPTLADDDLALFLAAHGTKERWRDLIWLCDFAELLKNRSGLDWNAVFHRAERSHLSRPLLLGMFLASSLLSAPAPAELVDRARQNPAVRSLARKAVAGMLRAAPASEVGQLLDSLEAFDHWRHKFGPVVALLTIRTISDYEAMPLPKALWHVYYFIRPFRLMTKIIATMVSGAKSDPNEGSKLALASKYLDGPSLAASSQGRPRRAASTSLV
jgi:putative nucleotidyltransferase-like protein